MCLTWFRLLFVFFFFKQKTAYEMRISDWCSYVCSSDLLTDHLARQMRLGDGARAQHRPERIAAAGARRSCRQAFEHRDRIGDRLDRHPARRLAHGRPALVDGRSDAMPLDQAVLT